MQSKFVYSFALLYFITVDLLICYYACLYLLSNRYCKCITCSIAGGPLPPRRNADGKCSKCLAQEIVEKDVNFYDSKIVNVCANDDFQNVTKNNNGAKRKNSALQEVGNEIYSTLSSVEEMLSCDVGMDVDQQSVESTLNGYHIAWAVFNHLNSKLDIS